MQERLLTTEQVAQILQVHPLTVLKYIKAGKLKGIKLGRVWRLREQDVESFLEDRSMALFPSDKTEKSKSEPQVDNQKQEDIEVEKTLSTENPPQKESHDHYIL